MKTPNKDVSVAAMEPRSFGTGQPFVIIPKDYRSEDLEQLMTAPVRKRGQVITSNTESFIAYTKKHGSLDDCTIYADVDSDKSHFKLVGVINDHGEDKPQWCDFRCELTPKLAIEWSRWTGADRNILQTLRTGKPILLNTGPGLRCGRAVPLSQTHHSLTTASVEFQYATDGKISPCFSPTWGLSQRE